MGLIINLILGIWVGRRLWNLYDDWITRWQVEKVITKQLPDGIIVVTFPRLRSRYRSEAQEQMVDQKLRDIQSYQRTVKEYRGEADDTRPNWIVDQKLYALKADYERHRCLKNNAELENTRENIERMDITWS